MQNTSPQNVIFVQREEGDVRDKNSPDKRRVKNKINAGIYQKK